MGGESSPAPATWRRADLVPDAWAMPCVTRQGQGQGHDKDGVPSALPSLPRPPATPGSRSLPLGCGGGDRACVRPGRRGGAERKGKGGQRSNEEMENFSCISCPEQARRLEGSVPPRH